jgi:hypothetical protein
VLGVKLMFSQKTSKTNTTKVINSVNDIDLILMKAFLYNLLKFICITLRVPRLKNIIRRLLNKINTTVQYLAYFNLDKLSS